MAVAVPGPFSHYSRALLVGLHAAARTAAVLPRCVQAATNTGNGAASQNRPKDWQTLAVVPSPDMQSGPAPLFVERTLPLAMA